MLRSQLPEFTFLYVPPVSDNPGVSSPACETSPWRWIDVIALCDLLPAELPVQQGYKKLDLNALMRARYYCTYHKAIWDGEREDLTSGVGCVRRTWTAFPLCLSLIVVLRVCLHWCLGALRLCAESRVSASSKGKGYSAPEQQKHLHEGSDLQDSN